jgi:hypothetical protein
MALDDLLKLAPAVGVALGLAIFFARQRRTAATMAEKVRAALQTEDSLSLPEIVTRVGLTDGFMNRGKVVNLLNPMVTSGELLQEEPPGTTFKNRLSVLRFRLRSKVAA